MTIKEFGYEPQHPEKAEDGRQQEDWNIPDELAQCDLLDIIFNNAKKVRITVLDLEKGFISFEDMPLTDLQNQISFLTSLVGGMDATYLKLNQDYKNAAKEAYKTFCIDNLLLINMLERRLNEGMRGE